MWSEQLICTPIQYPNFSAAPSLRSCSPVELVNTMQTNLVTMLLNENLDPDINVFLNENIHGTTNTPVYSITTANKSYSSPHEEYAPYELSLISLSIPSLFKNIDELKHFTQQRQWNLM